jgi:hypothetical protein
MYATSSGTIAFRRDFGSDEGGSCTLIASHILASARVAWQGRSPYPHKMPPATPITPRPYNLDEIRIIREEVKFQHTLIGTRVSWFVSAQAFLVTPFAICVANGIFRTYPLALVGIPFLGIALSILIIPGIHEAIRRIEEQHVLMSAYSTEHLIGPNDPMGQRKSLRFAVWAPWIFLVFWIVVVTVGFTLLSMK